MIVLRVFILTLLVAAPAVAQFRAGVHLRYGCSGDARTAVQDVPGNSNWRHVITKPGSYYLTDNIVGAQNIAGIRIDVSDVTIDFNGFALLGTDPGSLTSVASSADDVVLRGGGLIRGWSGGVSLGGARCRMEDMTVVDSLTNGLHLQGPDAIVLRCILAGNDWEGLHVGSGAHGATIADCKLRDNGRHQILVESDGNVIERCTITADVGVGTPALTLQGAMNVVRANSILLGAVGVDAIEVTGDGNRLLDNTIRLKSTATFGEGIAVTGMGNEVHGGAVTVESTSSTAIRFDQPLSIIAILIGLHANSDGSTGVLANAPGYLEQNSLYVGSANSIGVNFQGGAANVGSSLRHSHIRVAGMGATGVRALASASIVQMSGIVLEPGADNAVTIDVLGSAGGHTITANTMVLAGNAQGPILNGAGDLVSDNDILVLGNGSTALSHISGSGSLISANRIRLGGTNGTGIFVSEFVGDLLTKNIVLGDGTQFDVGEGNIPAQVVINPGFGSLAEDFVNLQIGN
jgi:hypothetical protein